MSADNGKRGSTGVAVSLVDVGPERLRLVFDDIKNQSQSEQGPWNHQFLFTFKDYDSSDIMDQNLPDQELADIGLNLILRLAALRSSSS